VEAVAGLSENATTLDTPLAYGYNERTLSKYKLAYEAMMKKKLVQGNQTGKQADLFEVAGTKKLAQGPGAHVQRAANTAAGGKQDKGDQGERMAKNRTTKIVVPKTRTTNSTNQGTSKTVVQRPGATSATTKCGSRSVVTRRDKQGTAAFRAKKRTVLTSKSRDGKKSVAIISRNQPKRKEGPHILQMFHGSKKPEPSGDKAPTRFEAMLILSKIANNRPGEEKLSVRSKLEDMGLAAIASNADEIESRRKRTETVCGIEKGA